MDGKGTADLPFYGRSVSDGGWDTVLTYHPLTTDVCIFSSFYALAPAVTRFILPAGLRNVAGHSLPPYLQPTAERALPTNNSGNLYGY